MKARLFGWSEKYLVNPVMRLVLRFGLAPRAFVLLETTGRRTGRPRQTPVNPLRQGEVIWVVAARGRRAGYVQNLLAQPEVRVKDGQAWRRARATVVDTDDVVARRRQIDRANGWVGRLDALAFYAGATDMASIRLDLDPVPDVGG